MTPIEANKIIAKFMGYDLKNHPTMQYRSGCLCRFQTMETTWWNEDGYDGITVPNYHTDLNTLVPVWDKMKFFPVSFVEGKVIASGTAYTENTLQEATAIATAKAIQAI